MTYEANKDPFYVSTPIYYVNAQPHLGHAYTTIAADVAARFQSMCGKETFFLTGTDEHGDKIAEAAQNSDCTPKEYADKISQLFQDLWPELSIKNDHFIRTTDPDHIKVVEYLLQKLYDDGEIYYSEYEGLYCVGCERYYQERELVDGKCPDHQKEPVKIKESNYFFKMSKYQQWLIDHINANPEFIRPQRYRNEVLSFLKEPLEDLCISRPKTRLQWGITLPFDDKYVTYVWVDALSNYLTALGYPNGEKFQKFWPNAQHLVAKDILKTHGIYWPTLLKAAGIEPFKHLNVHGFWNMGKAKMSKSLGNVASPMVMKEKYGVDAFRFFLMRDMVFGLDSNFTEEALVGRINADLANDLGNMFNRVVSMIHRYFEGKVPENSLEAEQLDDLSLKTDSLEAVNAFAEQMDGFHFHKGLAAVWELISKMNKYIDYKAPWALAKNPEDLPKLKSVMYNLLESLRVVSGLIYPVMPETSKTISSTLGVDTNTNYFDIDNICDWGTMKPGTEIGKAQVLFPRIDPEDLKKENEASATINDNPDLPDLKPEITWEEFSKVDLRVGTIVSAEPVPKAKRLLKLSVDISEARTVVAGISTSYAPDDIIGKQVAVVANLKPAKLMGIMSQGMLLAAVDKKKNAVLATLDKGVKPGTPLT